MTPKVEICPMSPNGVRVGHCYVSYTCGNSKTGVSYHTVRQCKWCGPNDLRWIKDKDSSRKVAEKVRTMGDYGSFGL